MISLDKRIFIAGANGMVGSSVVGELRSRGFANLLTPTSNELDLVDQAQVARFFESASPDIVVLAAAKVGGIAANENYAAEFIYRNLMIEVNVINAAFNASVEKLVFLSSSCAYPKDAAQPIREEALLSGPLAPENEPYAVAKIAGIKLCESYYREYGCNFISLMPTNLYGPNDNFDPETSHVIPALIRKFYEATERNDASVQIWGSGRPRREFMHVDDLADAILFALERIEGDDIYSQGVSQLNVGTGIDLPIIETAELIKEIAGFQGSIVRDESRPDGVERKLLDVSRMQKFGWRHRIEFREGLERVYDWYVRSLRVKRETAATLRG